MPTDEPDDIPPEERAKLNELSQRIRDALGKTPYPTFPEMTDADFIPRQDRDELDDLREWIRGQLVQGVCQSDIEDYLIGHGLDAEFAIAIVSSVRTTGQAHLGAPEYTVYVNGVPAGTETDPIAQRQLRLMRRRQRRDRAAVEGPSEPCPELNFGESNPTADARRYRRLQAIRYWSFILFFLALGAFVVLQALRD